MPAVPGTIGARLKELRGRARSPDGARLTQEGLAEASGVSVDLIKKLEQGRRDSAKLSTLRRLAEALQVPVTALVPSRGQEPGAIADAHAVDGGFLMIPAMPDPAPVSVSAGDVAAIRRMTASLTAADRQFGGTAARESASAYLHNVVRPRLDASAPATVHDDMFAAATELTLRAASMYLDAGKTAFSRRLLSVAFGMARETADPTLTGWVLARLGEQAIHERQIHHAVAYTTAAVGFTTKAPPVARAFLLAKQALATSFTGDRAGTFAIIGQLHDSYSRTGPSGEPSWIGNYGWGNLRHDEGLCHYRLGDGTQAAEAAADSLATEGRTAFARPHAFSLGLKACGYAIAGHVEEACATSQHFLEAAAGLSSARIRIRLQEMLHLLSEHGNRADVLEVAEAARPLLAAGS